MKINGTEMKVKAAALATFIGTIAGWALLESNEVAELVDRLPLPLQPIGAGLVLAGVAWFSGRAKRNVPEYLGQSTIEAVEERLRRQG